MLLLTYLRLSQILNEDLFLLPSGLLQENLLRLLAHIRLLSRLLSSVHFVCLGTQSRWSVRIVQIRMECRRRGHAIRLPT